MWAASTLFVSTHSQPADGLSELKRTRVAHFSPFLFSDRIVDADEWRVLNAYKMVGDVNAWDNFPMVLGIDGDLIKGNATHDLCVG